jgi:hypothetical protein
LRKLTLANNCRLIMTHALIYEKINRKIRKFQIELTVAIFCESSTSIMHAVAQLETFSV